MRRQSGYNVVVAWVLVAVISTGCVPTTHHAPAATDTLTPAPPRIAGVVAQLDQSFILGVEQSAVLAPATGQSATSLTAGAPITVTVLALAEEVRCPVGPTVACESAGYASFHLRLTQPTTSTTVTLSTAGGLPAEKATVGGYEIALLNVAPERTDQHREISKDEYLVTLILRAQRAASPTICERLRAAEAQAILGEPVHPQPIPIPDFGLQDGCAYALSRYPLPTGQAIMMGVVQPVVMVHQADSEQISTALQIVVSTLSEHPREIDQAVKGRVDTAIRIGKAKTALQLLDDLMVGEGVWQVEALTSISDAAVFVWGRLNAQQSNEQPLAALITLDRSGVLVVVTALLPTERSKDEVYQAMMTLAKRIIAAPVP